MRWFGYRCCAWKNFDAELDISVWREPWYLCEDVHGLFNYWNVLLLCFCYLTIYSILPSGFSVFADKLEFWLIRDPEGDTLVSAVIVAWCLLSQVMPRMASYPFVSNTNISALIFLPHISTGYDLHILLVTTIQFPVLISQSAFNFTIGIECISTTLDEMKQCDTPESKSDMTGIECMKTLPTTIRTVSFICGQVICLARAAVPLSLVVPLF